MKFWRVYHCCETLQLILYDKFWEGSKDFKLNWIHDPEMFLQERYN